MQSKASTPKQYMDSLPDDRKKAVGELRKAILENIPVGFEEVMNYGMLCYVVPHKLYPAGYHANPAHPLPFISLASQKNYISFYHMGLYEGELLTWFKKEWPMHTKTKLDMGKCCVRFKKTGDIPVPLIKQLVSKISPGEWIAVYENALKK